MTLKRPNKDSDIETIRAWRREYMRLYRQGNAKKRGMPQILNGLNPCEKYRQVSYYLDAITLERVQMYCESHGVSRNAMVGLSITNFFGHRRYKHEIKIADCPFSDKKFLHDRIESVLYDKVDEFTREWGKHERQMRITSVVEQAIREFVAADVQYAYGINLESGRNERRNH